MDKDTKLNSWIIASRPKTLLAALVPVMVGSAVAFNEHKLVIIYSMVALICSVLIQIGTNYANDLYDFIYGADNEKRKADSAADHGSLGDVIRFFACTVWHFCVCIPNIAPGQTEGKENEPEMKEQENGEKN